MSAGYELLIQQALQLVAVLLLVGVPVAVIGVAIYFYQRRRTRQLQRTEEALQLEEGAETRGLLESAAEELGLTFGDGAFRGLRGGVPVAVRSEGEGDFRRVVIEATGLADGYWLSSHMHGQRPEFETGDEAFDARFLLSGDERRALAALSEGARRRALALGDGRNLSVVGGRLQLVPVLPRIDPKLLGGYLDAAALLAAEMGGEEGVDRRLLEIAGDDPEPEVREACLRALLTSPQTDPQVRHAAGALAAGASGIEIRVWAALEHPAAMREELVDAVWDASLPPSLRARALIALSGVAGESERGDAWSQALHNALLDEDLGLRVAAARAVVRRGQSEVSPEVEETLMGLRGLVEGEERRAVIEALGVCGTRRSVALLRPFTVGMFTDNDQKRVAVEALEAIQARLVPAPGGLSLADGGQEGGALSLAQGGGAVSLARLDKEPAEPEGG